MKNILKKISIIFGCLGLISVFSIPCVLALGRKENIEVKADYSPSYYGATTSDITQLQSTYHLNYDLAYSIYGRPTENFGTQISFISFLDYYSYNGLKLPSSVLFNNVEFRLGLFASNRLLYVDLFSVDSYGHRSFGFNNSNSPHFLIPVTNSNGSSTIVFSETESQLHEIPPSLMDLLGRAQDIYDYSNSQVRNLIETIGNLQTQISLNNSALESLQIEYDSLNEVLLEIEELYLEAQNQLAPFLYSFNQKYLTDFDNLQDCKEYIDDLELNYRVELIRLRDENHNLNILYNDLLNQVDSTNAVGNTFSLIRSAFGGLVPLLNVEIAPNISVGMLLTIPFVITIIGFAIKLLG